MATSNLPTPQLASSTEASELPGVKNLLPLVDGGIDAGACCGGGSCSIG
ncbi:MULTISPECIES: hypothetical protein [Microbacterium]|nr:MULTISPECIES: hypothetical protein [Microbacterium]QOC25185.1 hypothetical protein IC745_12665 [Microbacterium hominis]QYF98586.1 hypothetical protein KY498_04915 [Microbacterium sp. PAMC21962]